MLELSDPISKIPLVGPSYTRRLEKLDIKTVRDLLYHLPFRYDDFSIVSKIADVQEGETVTVQGEILDIKNIFTRRGFVLQKAVVADESGKLPVIWFNQRFLISAIQKGDLVSLSGKVNKHQLESPDYEIIKGDSLEGDSFKGVSLIHTGRLVPVYPETTGVSSKWLRGRINFVLNNIKVIEFLPETSMMTEQEAIKKVHFPDNLTQAEKARQRLAFDELLISQLESKYRRQKLESKTVGNKFKIVEIREKLKTFVENLPFKLTGGQKKAIDEIYKDLSRDTPMNRLLQGDVGSGKTVVAALTMLAAKFNGFQAGLMAPTEILANQHWQTFQQMGIPAGLATGANKKNLDSDILIGTHALLYTDFKKLGLVIIDEQHRFGVKQRAALAALGKNPHVLTMTATPIPRTVALTLYGDLDMSILSELPAGRKKVKTWVVPDSKRQDAYKWLADKKTFIICPLIEESETLTTVKAVTSEYEHLQQIFPKKKLGLIHGRLNSKEKNKVLTAFKKNRLDILVATPVVEVGLDITDATVMVIEAADRFGLAQLHQLRGRVGRGERQSYCLLFGESPRLKYLEKVNSGLELAEIDLKFRGPGERLGTAQHGQWDLKIADFSDLELVEKTNFLAQKVLGEPSKFPLLLQMLDKSKIILA